MVGFNVCYDFYGWGSSQGRGAGLPFPLDSAFLLTFICLTASILSCSTQYLCCFIWSLSSWPTDSEACGGLFPFVPCIER